MLHHVSLPVVSLSASTALYDAALGALGYRRVWTVASAVGYGIVDGQDKLCLMHNPAARAASAGFHLAFTAPTRAAVDGFHAAAIASGATDHGRPGLREQYGAGYYAAFVIDPDGHRLEAVCKGSPDTQ